MNSWPASMLKVAVKSHGDAAARPSDLLTRVNRTLCGSYNHGFVTAAYVFVDLQRREGTISCGGHPHPLLRRKTDPELREVGTGGIVLGRFSDAEYGQERLTMYTDGIVEAQDQGGTVFGVERLRRLLVESDGQSADELCDAVMRQVYRWTSGRPEVPQEDDLTLMVIDLLS